jgi:hypothetical protein
MRGILAHVPPKVASPIARSKTKRLEIPRSTDVAKDDVVIGIDQKSKSEAWAVTLTARVWTVPKQGDDCRLKDVKFWPEDERWELPKGLPVARDFTSMGAEPVSEDLIPACLTDFSKIAGSLPKPRVPKLCSQVLRGVSDAVVIAFKGGRPEVWIRERMEEQVTSDAAVYQRVLRRFLHSFPAPVKGWVFEDILQELFRAMDCGFECVLRTPKTRDGGTDLVLVRNGPVTGREEYLVQAKNLSTVVQPTDIHAFRSVCQEHGVLKGIFVAPGGFSPQAAQTARAIAQNPPIELIDLDRLTDLVWRHIESMPITTSRFLEWCGQPTTGQGSLPLSSGA